jgi:uncharacterized membrane protein (DUF373 family)
MKKKKLFKDSIRDKMIWFGTIFILLLILIIFLANRPYSLKTPIETNIFAGYSAVITAVISVITILHLYKTYLETVKQNSRIALETSFKLID